MLVIIALTLIQLLHGILLKKQFGIYISKKENFKIPIFGKLIRKCCFLEIDRDNPKNAIKTIQVAGELLEKEVSIGVYPEGTRNKKGGLLIFHNGVFKIAQKANSSIVVILVTGTEKVHKSFPFHKTDVCIEVVDVISNNDIKLSTTSKIGQRVSNKLFEKIDGR